MLEKLHKLSSKQATVIITITGFVIYARSLINPFIGDDNGQILQNKLVHSIGNARLFFEGGTFYNGQQLTGVYYRPLMTTVYSILYTIFGPHAFYFHLLQLLFVIASVVVLYLFFRYSFKPILSLILVLIFLIHPIDSQVVYEISALQDVLFFFFGILAMYLLLRFNSIRSLVLVAICLLLSLFAKETGVLFVVMTGLFLLVWDRRRGNYPLTVGKQGCIL